MIGTCKNCLHHCIDSPEWGCFGSPDLVCNNENSMKYGYITDNDDSCIEWKNGRFEGLRRI